MKKIKIFISSTFLDFQDERKILHQKVFPKLNSFLKKFETEIVPVDMMWGVNEHLSGNNKIIDTCLTEIERCQENVLAPYFLLLIGNRYGSIFPPSKITLKMFSIILNECDKREKNILNKFYYLDNNEIPPSYILHKKDTEKSYIPILNIFFKKSKANAIIKKFCDTNLISITELEIRKGLFGKFSPNPNNVIIFYKDTNILKNDEDNVKKQKLSSLKQSISKYYFSAVNNYNSPQKNDNLLADFFYQKIKEQILKNNINEKAYINQLIKNYYDKNYKNTFLYLYSIQELINKNINQATCNFICLEGDEYSAKNFFLANLIVYFEKFYKTNNFSKLILIKINLLIDSKVRYFNHLVLNILDELDHNNKQFFDTLNDIELVFELKRQLQNISYDITCIIVLDSIDFIIDRDLNYIFSLLQSIKKSNIIFITTLHHTNKKTFIDNYTKIEFPPFHYKPSFNSTVYLYLMTKNRKLTKSQIYQLKQFYPHIESSQHFYTILEHLTHIKHNEQLSLLSMENYFESKIIFLEKDHGKELIKTILILIYVAINGITESELLNFIQEDKKVLDEFYTQYNYAIKTNNIPRVVLSRALYDLKSLIIFQTIDNDTAIYFANERIKNFVENKIVSSSFKYYISKLILQHRRLNHNKNIFTTRFLSEVPFLYIKIKKYNNFLSIITKIQFLESMLVNFDIHRIIYEYKTYYKSFKNKKILSILKFFQKNIFLLKKEKKKNKLLSLMLFQGDRYTKELALNYCLSNQIEIYPKVISKQKYNNELTIDIKNEYPKQAFYFAFRRTSQTEIVYEELETWRYVNFNFPKKIFLYYVINTKDTILFFLGKSYPYNHLIYIYEIESQKIIHSFDLRNDVTKIIYDKEKRCYYFLLYPEGIIRYDLNYPNITIHQNSSDVRFFMFLEDNIPFTNSISQETKNYYLNKCKDFIFPTEILSQNNKYCLVNDNIVETYTGKIICQIKGKACFSKDSKYIAFCYDEYLSITNLDLQQTNTIKLETYTANLQYTIDNKYILLGLQNGYILKIHPVSLKILNKAKIHSLYTHIKVLNETKILTYSIYESKIKIFDIDSLFNNDIYFSHSSKIELIHYINNTKFFSYSYFAKYPIKIWDLNTGKLIKQYEHKSDIIKAIITYYKIKRIDFDFFYNKKDTYNDFIKHLKYKYVTEIHNCLFIKKEIFIFAYRTYSNYAIINLTKTKIHLITEINFEFYYSSEVSNNFNEILLITGFQDGLYFKNNNFFYYITFYDYDQYLLKKLDTHTDSVNSVHFSTDSKYFVSTSDDCTCIIWETSTLTEIQTIRFKNRVIYGIFSQNNQYIIVATDDNIIHIIEKNSYKIIDNYIHNEDITKIYQYNKRIIIGDNIGQIIILNYENIL